MNTTRKPSDRISTLRTLLDSGRIAEIFPQESGTMMADLEWALGKAAEPVVTSETPIESTASNLDSPETPEECVEVLDMMTAPPDASSMLTYHAMMAEQNSAMVPHQTCPCCNRKIVDIMGEAPTAIQTWVCSDCIDGGMVPKSTRVGTIPSETVQRMVSDLAQAQRDRKAAFGEIEKIAEALGEEPRVANAFPAAKRIGSMLKLTSEEAMTHRRRNVALADELEQTANSSGMPEVHRAAAAALRTLPFRPAPGLFPTSAEREAMAADLDNLLPSDFSGDGPTPTTMTMLRKAATMLRAMTPRDVLDLSGVHAALLGRPNETPLDVMNRRMAEIEDLNLKVTMLAGFRDQAAALERSIEKSRTILGASDQETLSEASCRRVTEIKMAVEMAAGMKESIDRARLILRADQFDTLASAARTAIENLDSVAAIMGQPAGWTLSAVVKARAVELDQIRDLVGAVPKESTLDAVMRMRENLTASIKNLESEIDETRKTLNMYAGDSTVLGGSTLSEILRSLMDPILGALGARNDETAEQAAIRKIREAESESIEIQERRSAEPEWARDLTRASLIHRAEESSRTAMAAHSAGGRILSAVREMHQMAFDSARNKRLPKQERRAAMQRSTAYGVVVSLFSATGRIVEKR